MFCRELTFAGSRGSCLNTRPLRDSANVNVMKQTCAIVGLAFYLITVENCTKKKKRRKIIKIVVFRTLNLIVQNDSGLQNRTVALNRAKSQNNVFCK